MNEAEALQICRIAKAGFPATNVDEFTPDAWSLALEDDRFEDARDALKGLMREQTFIHVSDIVKRIKRIRNDRIMAYGPMPAPPRELKGDQAELGWMRAMLKRVGDGEILEAPAIESGPNARQVDYTKVFKSVDGDMIVDVIRNGDEPL